MSNIQTYFPDKPVHPGAILLDTLDFLSLPITEVSERTGISQKHLSTIINGKALITAEVALKLENSISLHGYLQHRVQFDQSYQAFS